MILRILRRFVPDREMWITIGIDLATAAGIWVTIPYLPDMLQWWARTAVHVLVLMAVWNPLQHWRRQYHMHVKRAWEIMTGMLVAMFAIKLPVLAGGPQTCPTCGETRHTDDIDSWPLEGQRTFACGFAMDTEGHGRVCQRTRKEITA